MNNTFAKDGGDLQVLLKKLNKRFNFSNDELIWTELSKKYSLVELDHLAEQSGFRINKHFLDSKHYFIDSLLIKS
ncbi:L-histidine N(alpha)-methyltransferase [Aureibaculum sp. A20]|uniref:L-histidine N(Alpha)-methyltransferase n=1 Tax=Aureibaculum flavum TaxID=2795986 RepID=A0ABS0WTC8_9FLAO|nr:L-histidine N(alpha)-methyltransferase [Aureibaculum flavum]MBJ2175223.1 L-histidine N(alpha)-methyltransferase [Aureibaculum flavum]